VTSEKILRKKSFNEGVRERERKGRR